MEQRIPSSEVRSSNSTGKLKSMTLIMSIIAGGVAGFFGAQFFQASNTPSNDQLSNTSVVLQEESSTISVIEQASPAVVSIIVSKDLPKIESYYNPFQGDPFFDNFFQTPQQRQNGTERREIGGGSGFIVSPDGYIVTNKHVVLDEDADYTVLLNDETQYDAEVVARDTVNDIAILKIEAENLPVLELGDSTNLQLGQRVIAIGNALGEFRNTVSTGIISGLARSIVAGGVGFSEQLTGLIQTDAAVNSGNSGGPLLNSLGQVIAVNTAVARSAENIGFAIPIDEVAPIIESVQENGRIVRPFLGVRYMLINEELQAENQLPVDYGALIVRGDQPTALAVVPGSPADKAGIVENDIILEVDGQTINESNPLAKVLTKYAPGDTIELRVYHRGDEVTRTVTLDEYTNN